MRNRHALIAFGLAVCLLVVTGSASAQAVPHAAHHAHHKAATHGTAFCAWMCAAGQVLSAGGIHLDTDFGPVMRAGTAPCPEPAVVSLPSFTIRGPPLPLV